MRPAAAEEAICPYVSTAAESAPSLGTAAGGVARARVERGEALERGPEAAEVVVDEVPLLEVLGAQQADEREVRVDLVEHLRAGADRARARGDVFDVALDAS